MIKEKVNNPVLAKRLRWTLIITLLAALVLATITAAVTAYLDASDVQDETLLSVAHLVDTNQIIAQFDPSFLDHHRYDEGVRVWEVGGKSHSGFKLRGKKSSGFQTQKVDGTYWRVYLTRSNQFGKRYAIAQKLEVSAEAAFNSVMNTAIPLLCLSLLVPLLVTGIVKYSFKPLNKLSEQVSNTDSLDLELSDDNEIPVEIMPFISSIETLLEKNAAYNQQQRRFIADAAHELRTPITALSLEIENLQKPAPQAETYARQTSITNSVHRLHRLVNQLLDLARAQSIESGSTQAINLNEVVKAQIAELYILAEEKHIELIVERNEQLSLLDCGNQLSHLVRNALSNAIKYTPENGKVKIELFHRGAQGVFRVSDTGPGVSQEHLENLMQPFYRPAHQATKIGAGLGLAICNEIANRLNGSLSLSNIAPSGFRFEYAQPITDDGNLEN